MIASAFCNHPLEENGDERYRVSGIIAFRLNCPREELSNNLRGYLIQGSDPCSLR
jgi:hypothetical protein